MHTPGRDREGRRIDAKQTPARAPAAALDPVARKEQQLVFLLTRQLVDAQIVSADRERSERLWQEVAALELDPERITALIYGVGDHTDRHEMEAVDRLQLNPTLTGHAHSWFFNWGRPGSRAAARRRGAGRRSAPPAGPRAHQQVR